MRLQTSSVAARVPDDDVNELELAAGDRSNRRIMLHVWLSYVLEANTDYLKQVIKTFKRMIGSPNHIFSGMQTENVSHFPVSRMEPQQLISTITSAFKVLPGPPSAPNISRNAEQDRVGQINQTKIP